MNNITTNRTSNTGYSPAQFLDIPELTQRQINAKALQALTITPEGLKNIDNNSIRLLNINELNDNELLYAGFALGSFLGVVRGIGGTYS